MICHSPATLAFCSRESITATLCLHPRTLLTLLVINRSSLYSRPSSHHCLSNTSIFYLPIVYSYSVYLLVVPMWVVNMLVKRPTCLLAAVSPHVVVDWCVYLSAHWQLCYWFKLYVSLRYSIFRIGY